MVTPTGNKKVDAIMCIPDLGPLAPTRSSKGIYHIHSRDDGGGTQEHIGTGKDIVDQTQDHEHEVCNAA